jgi:pentatricopeptide repeat protein
MAIANPGVEAYTSLLAGYASDGNIEDALRIYDLMKLKAVSPNAHTFTSLISACVNADRLDLAKDLISSFSDSSAVNYASKEIKSAIYGMYAVGLSKKPEGSGMQEAKEVLEYMKSSGLSIDAATVNSYILSLCSSEPALVPEALSFVQSAIENGMIPDEYTYSILFTALGKHGMIEEVNSIFLNASQVLHKLDAQAINSLLRALVSGAYPLSAGFVSIIFTR